MTGERPAFIDADDASIQLASRLDQKNCLLVFDDVWDASHLAPFMRGGPQCARLITTRQLSIASDFADTRISVDRLTRTQAIEMLTARIEHSADDFAALESLAAKLGEWPLLLKLARSQLRKRLERGDTVGGALSYVGRALDKRGATAFDPAAPVSRSDAVASTIEASLALLSEADQGRCAELAVLRHETSFSIAAVGALWGLDELDTEDLLLRLDDVALLEFDLKTAEIRQHHVIRSFLESRLGRPAELHAKLVESWLENPNQLPDNYARMWIGWHLVHAGQADRLKKLLCDFDWLAGRLESVPVHAVLRDFEQMELDEDLRTIRDALQLAAHGISFDPAQLRVQIQARVEYGRSQIVDALLDNSEKSESGLRIGLAGASLTHPGGALTGIIRAHGGAVTAMAASPDGRWVVSGTEDFILRLWDHESNSLVRSLEGHAGIIRTVAFTPDGESVLSGSEDRSLRLWDVNTGEEKWIVRENTLPIQAIAVSRNGELASCVSEDGTARIWDLTFVAPKAVFKGRGHQMNATVISGDGIEMAFGAGDCTIWRVNLESNTQQILEGHSATVHCLTLTPDEEILLSGADDGTVRAWNWKTCHLLFELLGHWDAVDSIAVMPDGKKAVTGSRDQTLRVWDLKTGEHLRTLDGHSGSIKAVVVSASTGQVISGSTDRTIRCWDIDSSSKDHQPCPHNQPVVLLSMSSDGTRTISGTWYGDLTVWESLSPANHDNYALEPAESLPPQIVGSLDGHTKRVSCLRMTANGELAFTGSRDQTLRSWNVGETSCKRVLNGHTKPIIDLDVAPNETCIASLAADRTLRVWDLENGLNTRVLVYEDDLSALSKLRLDDPMLADLDPDPEIDVTKHRIGRDTRFAISPDGSLLVLGTQGSICAWNLESGEVRYAEFGDLSVEALAFGGASTKVIAGSHLGTLLVWDLRQEAEFLRGHRGRILDICVAEDGKTATTAARDDTFRIWDLESFEEIAQFTGPVGKADAVAIAPANTIAYSIYGDTLVAHDLRRLATIGSLSFDHQITSIAVTPQGHRVAIGDQSGRVHFVSLVG